MAGGKGEGMKLNWEDRVIVKVIWFSALTALAVVIWAEVIGMERIIFVVLVILGFSLRRILYEKR